MLFKLLLFLLICYGCAPKPLTLSSKSQEEMPALVSAYPSFNRQNLPKSHVESFLNNNFDYKKAILNLEKSYASLQKTYADFYPSVQLEAGGRRNRFLFQEIEEYTIGGALSFSIDPFGRLRSLKRAAEKNYKASFYDLQSLDLTLKNQFIKQLIDLIYTQKNIKIIQKNYTISQQIISTTKRFYEQGKVDAGDLLTAMQNSKTIYNSQIQQKQLFAQKKSTYALLLGKNEVDIKIPSHFFALPPLSNSQVLYTDILDQRPDIIAAKLRFEASGEALDASISALYPSIVFSFSVQNVAQAVETVLSKENIISALGLNLTQLLFDGGKVRSNITISEKDAKIAKLNYLESLTKATLNIDTLFEGMMYQKKRLQNTLDNLHLAQKNFALSQESYMLGRTPLLNLLNIHSKKLQAETEHLQAKKQLQDYYSDFLLSIGQPAFRAINI